MSQNQTRINEKKKKKKSKAKQRRSFCSAMNDYRHFKLTTPTKNCVVFTINSKSPTKSPIQPFRH